MNFVNFLAKIAIVLNFRPSVIASKNECKRVFAWQSIKSIFDNGLPHFALRLVRNDAEFMNFRAKRFKVLKKCITNKKLTKRKREREREEFSPKCLLLRRL